MNIPEFTAQASLYRTSNHYRSLAFDSASPQRTVLVPQLGGPGFEGFGNCISDCADLHPGWTAARCGAACHASDGPPRVGYGSSCENSPPSECYILLGACCVDPYACAFICPGFHEICLENSRRECLIARHGPLRGASG
jgi:hypothetical protein